MFKTCFNRRLFSPASSVHRIKASSQFHLSSVSRRVEFTNNIYNSVSRSNPNLPRGWSKRHLIVGAIVGSGIFFYYTNNTVHDFLKHIGHTIRRTSIVTQATIRCFYNYKKTLNTDYPDEDSRLKALSDCHLKCALITLNALQRNGGIYIKLGQHIGAMTYLLPPEWTETMIPLQDQCPESTLIEIDNMFKQDLKKSIDEIFIEFDPKPIGVASLAQVHIATLIDSGEKVAVKCQHPSLKEFIPLDVMLTQTVFNLLDVVFPEYPLTWLGDELQSSIYIEIDFKKEAANAIQTQAYFANFKRNTAIRIPNVISANKRILIMEYVNGKRLDDLNYLDKNNISRAEVSSCLSHIFNNMIFTPNVGIHCDPHGGNLAIRAIPYGGSANPHNFEIVLFDHGLYRYPSTRMRRDYAKFWLALLDHDQEKMKLYAKRFANIDPEQFPLFAAAITGRSIDTALNYDISKRRSDTEIKVMSDGIVSGAFLANLMSILSTIPRIVLLILKTNDLTRHLDECLQNPLGPERTFLIMTQYCAKTVYDEDCEDINKTFSRWSVYWMWSHFISWFIYEKRKNQLVLYDLAFWWKQHVLTN
ncbi:hypothetical protein Kpol_1061p24 [Vanderwaltozyma polyspora DSM 70294]|uniref:ABC1 atypical kinase-like domain-containing protein n=1 Tax=Vanderwaltozyma polyspora (strain ATCC 22028 / DSM 70294 / BCRC 21397 / CBS 2163 / NBRC 10782 / NRRL Y-8283 / UCD 57-17) TaxID=436907 RepID=A7TJF0_VANPO|nr:uncharacterized protein Kpol_1061p24 [Vanderwaltozyma polyspora DSM 70294]EDO17600.1 hypothetical protein Kpol_1061p24 [Vanderwaltozyma polyspora DSM 70294]